MKAQDLNLYISSKEISKSFNSDIRQENTYTICLTFYEKFKEQLFFVKIANAEKLSNNDRLPAITVHICPPAVFFMIYRTSA